MRAVDRLLLRLSVCAASVAVALVVATGALIISPALRDSFGIDSAAASPGYRIGDRFDLDDDVLGSAARTAVLFLRSTCPACQAAVPDLKRFVADVSHTAGAQVVMVTMPSPPASELELASSIGLTPAQLITTDVRQLRLREVPTLVVLNQRREVLFAAAGVPSQDDLHSALTLLTTQ